MLMMSTLFGLAKESLFDRLCHLLWLTSQNHSHPVCFSRSQVLPGDARLEALPPT
jgi:hypothetical protein